MADSAIADEAIEIGITMKAATPVAGPRRIDPLPAAHRASLGKTGRP